MPKEETGRSKERGWPEPMIGKWYASVNRKLPGVSKHLARHTMIRFGFWKSRDEWLQFLESTDKGFRRTLNPIGRLEYKICEMSSAKSVGRKDIDLMRGFAIIKEKRTKSNRGNTTIWLTMKPKSAVNSQTDFEEFRTRIRWLLHHPPRLLSTGRNRFYRLLGKAAWILLRGAVLVVVVLGLGIVVVFLLQGAGLWP